MNRGPFLIFGAFVAAVAVVVYLAFVKEGTEDAATVPVDAVDEPSQSMFATNCGACHTLAAAGTDGSANRALRNQGPNLDQRVETDEDVLYAIRNGGFSGAIMPQNIVVGDEAEAVAAFVAEYAGDDVERPPSPQAVESSAEAP